MKRPIWEGDDDAPLPQPGTRRPAYRLGHLILTTTEQPRGCAIIDRATTRDGEGRVYSSLAILRRWWRRDPNGQRAGGPALIVGWQVHAAAGSAPLPPEERAP